MTGFPKVQEIFCQRFKLLEELGAGGVGCVFKAFQLDGERLLAIKIIHAEISDDPEFRERAIRESRALAKLSHPGIVQIYHIGQSEEGLIYLAMELVDGKSLRRHLIEAEGKLGTLEAVKLTREIANTLQFVHENKIVHRDLKPENIMIVQKQPYSSKILDFGLAFIENEQKLTNTGMLIGTASYMSPEQCRGMAVDHRSDIYSLAICLFEMLKGSKPYDADSSIGLIYKQINEPLPEIKKQDTDKFDPEINKVLAKATAKEPEQRFQSMSEFSDALLALENTLLTSPSKTARMLRSASLFLLIIVGFGLLYQPFSKHSKKIETELDRPIHHSLNRRLSFSEAIDLAGLAKRAATDSRDIKQAKILISEALTNKRLDPKSRAILLIGKNYLDSKTDDLLSNDEIFRLAELSYRKNPEPSTKSFLLACSVPKIESLLSNRQAAEAFELSKSMIKLIDENAPQIRVNFGAIIAPANKGRLLILQCRSALMLNRISDSKKIMNQLAKLDYGGFETPEQISSLLLKLNMGKELKDYILSLSSAYKNKSNSYFYEFHAIMNYQALCTISEICLQSDQSQLAKLALSEAEAVERYSSANHAAFNPSVDIRVRQADYYIKTGDKHSGEKLLRKTANEWISAQQNSKKKSRLRLVNPMSLLEALLQAHLNQEAKEIISILSADLSDFPCLNPSFKDLRLQNSYARAIKVLTPFADEKFVSRFMKELRRHNKNTPDRVGKTPIDPVLLYLPAIKSKEPEYANRND